MADSNIPDSKLTEHRPKQKTASSEDSYIAVSSDNTTGIKSAKAPLFLTISYATVWLLAIFYLIYLQRRIQRIEADLIELK